MNRVPIGLFSAQIKGFLEGSMLKVGHFFNGVSSTLNQRRCPNERHLPHLRGIRQSGSGHNQ